MPTPFAPPPMVVPYRLPSLPWTKAARGNAPKASLLGKVYIVVKYACRCDWKIVPKLSVPPVRLFHRNYHLPLESGNERLIAVGAGEIDQDRIVPLGVILKTVPSSAVPPYSVVP